MFSSVDWCKAISFFIRPFPATVTETVFLTLRLPGEHFPDISAHAPWQRYTSKINTSPFGVMFHNQFSKACARYFRKYLTEQLDAFSSEGRLCFHGVLRRGI
jgi:hypothetical protein